MTEPPQSPPTINETTISGVPVSRRSFLSIAWKALLGISGVLGLSGLVRFFSYQSLPTPPTEFDLGPIESLPRNSAITIPEAQAVLLPSEDGFQAISLVCTHLGCLLELQEETFNCPCHGSIFSMDGTVQKGPADQSLRQLKVSLDQNKHLILDISER